jgi:hypothetical protein
VTFVFVWPVVLVASKAAVWGLRRANPHSSPLTTLLPRRARGRRRCSSRRCPAVARSPTARPTRPGHDPRTRAQRMKTVATLKIRRRLLLVRMRGDQRGIQIDDQWMFGHRHRDRELARPLAPIPQPAPRRGQI